MSNRVTATSSCANLAKPVSSGDTHPPHRQLVLAGEQEPVRVAADQGRHNDVAADEGEARPVIRARYQRVRGARECRWSTRSSIDGRCEEAAAGKSAQARDCPAWSSIDGRREE